ncbi:MAG: hypothetical protein ABEJ79_12480 [Halolamina sp.]
MQTPIETAADGAALVDALPEPPAGWQHSVDGGAVVEYRLPGDDGVCAAAKLTVRPDVLGDAAVRVDRTRGCKSAGTTYHGGVAEAVEAVETELRTASETLNDS